MNFNIGGSTTTTRQWDIYVTQYTCAQEDLGGPPGCLQFFTGTTGLAKTFGYPTTNTGTAVQAASSTHLQNQNYNICVRREKGYCYICWAEWYTAATMGSFGLSLSDAAASKSQSGSRCTSDFITIPQGNTDAIAQTTTAAAGNSNRFCGRFLNPAAEATTPLTVCSKLSSFKETCRVVNLHLLDIKLLDIQAILNKISNLSSNRWWFLNLPRIFTFEKKIS